MEEDLVIHSDGGARGNPGPGACAFTVEENGKLIAKDAKFLGKVTNNFAEYSGVILALQWLIKDFVSEDNFPAITFYLDSELVAKQLMGLYKIKNESLKKLNNEARRLIEKHNLEIIFKTIPREKNKLADFLVNQKLDKIISG